MSYTLKEFYHVHGRLEPDQIERLIEIAELAKQAVDSLPCLDEAIAQYPDEDVFNDLLENNSLKAKRMRELLQRDKDMLVQQAYFGIDELDKVRVALKQLEKGIDNG